MFPHDPFQKVVRLPYGLECLVRLSAILLYITDRPEHAGEPIVVVGHIWVIADQAFVQVASLQVIWHRLGYPPHYSSPVTAVREPDGQLFLVVEDIGILLSDSPADLKAAV